MTIRIRHAAFMGVASLGLSACASNGIGAEQPNLPHLLVASSESRVGGEARFEGRLEVWKGCVVAASNGRTILPIFDPTIRMDGTGKAILDSNSGERISIGTRFRASAAYLRENGTGWSVADIQRILGVTVPPGCGDTIVRLKAAKLVGEQP